MSDSAVSDVLKDEPFPVTLVSSETVFEGAVWNIRRDMVEYGGGRITREYMDHSGAVAILALDDQGRVLLIKQYRQPLGLRDWEIPAGLLDIHGEDPLIAAQRELAEEVDLVAARWDLLSDFNSSPGGSNEVIRIYLARELTATATAFDRTEEELDIEKRWADLDDVVSATLERTIGNSILTIAALSAQASRARGWSSLGDPHTPWPKARD
ncbi:MAG: NUDIX hydrolase [Actinomycetota bacterium]